MEQQANITPAEVEIDGSSLVVPDFTPAEVAAHEVEQVALTGEIIGHTHDAPLEAHTVESVPHPERLAVAAKLPQNDLGIGQRIALHYKEKLAFVIDEMSGKANWHVYNPQNGVWEKDAERHLVKKLATRVISSLQDEVAYVSSGDAARNQAQQKIERAKSLPEGKARDRMLAGAEAELAQTEGATLAKHIRFAESSGAGKHWLYALDTAEGLLTRSLSEFDTEKDCINTKSGYLNLRTLELLPHSPANLVTMVTSAAYDPSARHADVEKIIARLDEAGHEGLGLFSQRILGTGLTGYPASKTSFYQEGTADSAKSTVILAAVEAMGMQEGGYAKAGSARAFCRPKGGGSPVDVDLHTYKKKRMVFCDEAENAGILGSPFKLFVSGEPISSRGMHEMTHQWYPEGTLVFAGNGMVGIPTDDAGVARRFVCCSIKTAVKNVDEAMRERLRSPKAQSAMLSWLVEGAHAWLTADRSRDALCITQQILDETAAFTGDADPFVDFLDECVDTNPAVGEYLPVKFGIWMDVYTSWCQLTGTKPKPNRVVRDYLRRFATESSPTTASYDGWSLATQSRVMLGIAMKQPDYAALERRGLIKRIDSAPSLNVIKLAA